MIRLRLRSGTSWWRALSSPHWSDSQQSWCQGHATDACGIDRCHGNHMGVSTEGEAA
jgi:hypothetical protein